MSILTTALWLWLISMSFDSGVHLSIDFFYLLVGYLLRKKRRKTEILLGGWVCVKGYLRI
jgi:hypothetical protein